MKPSQVEYSNFTVNNVGSNPVNVWKKVDVVSRGGGLHPESELLEDPSDTINNIDSVISYDLSVKLKNPSQTVVWEQTLYNMDKTISQINGQGTFLGMIPSGWSMDVVESYHMLASTTNWAQGDVMNFNITLTGEQLTGTVVLEDKDSASAPWIVKSGTAPQVTFTYGVKDSTLKINTLTGKTVVSGSHSLITYPEAFSTPSGVGWPGTGIVLATVTVDGSGTITSFAQVATNPGTFTNMKVWLIPSSDLTGATFNVWNPNNYLFDTGLVDYYDSF